MNTKIIILIPAYNPTIDLINLVKDLKNNLYENIVVVNDGSSESYMSIFDTISNFCTTIHHSKNCGKGKALKTGFEYIYNNYQNNYICITVDADGQHLVKDINKVRNFALKNKNHLVLGCRNFKEAKVPFRNRIGNLFISLFFNLIYKVKLQDTQTGLRAIPSIYIPELLNIKGTSYEYEQNMLIYFVKNFKEKISYVTITAVYNKNQSSYFNIFKDSIKILKCVFKRTKN